MRPRPYLVQFGPPPPPTNTPPVARFHSHAHSATEGPAYVCHVERSGRWDMRL